jgi:chaperonin GroES
MNIVPHLDQVLVLRDAEDRITAGGLHIPTVADNPKLPRGRGVVLAVGPGIYDKKGRRIVPDVRVGERVVFSKLSGDKVRDDLAVMEIEADLVLIREVEILCAVDLEAE